ncbi:MAG: hypothetical protein AAFO69_07590 [Bacteroidota bacterium]
MWVQATETQNHTSSTYIYWSGEHFFQNTGQGELVYPIYINTPGTYRFVWRMKVGKGIDVTNHNDNWLKVQGAQLYGQKPNGHRIAPQPGCTWMEGYDCPNGSSENGFFKVYGQDTSFIWQAQTSDNDGHELFVDFPRTGKYEIILHARSSHCWLDRLVFFHTQKISYAEATDIQQKATLPLKQPHTTVSIKDNQFYINGRLTYEGRYFHHHKIEGLLFNARLVQGIFDDLNPGSRDGFAYPDTQIWDPDRNTDEFVAAMSSWREHGLLAFTLNLQGGSPLGYGNKDWINSAFDPQGQLRPAYLNRLEKILNRADELGMVVILGYFYFGQDQQLQGEAAVINAVDNITNWILDKGYKNILVELNNECDIYYDHAILQAERIHELIDRVRKTEKGGFRLLVGTSYSGGHIPRSNVVQVSDYLLLHGNSVENPAQISDMIRRTRQLPEYNNQPILFNEDDHYDYDQPKNNLQAAIDGYASWGYFDFRREDDEFSAGFQTVPVDWRINSPRKIDFFEKIKEITGQ